MTKMLKGSQRNKFLWLIGFLVLLLVIALVFRFAWPDKFRFGDKLDDQQAEPVKVVKTELGVKEYPEGFPADVPMEEGAKVTHNYNATTNDTKNQGTRVFESGRSLDENKKIYEDYFKQNGWGFTQNISDGDLRMISATKGEQQMLVVVSQNSISKKIKVTITVSDLPQITR